jgi:hypothetical protein
MPYNYTSFSHREIVIRILGAQTRDLLNKRTISAAPGPLGAHALRGVRRANSGGIERVLL